MECVLPQTLNGPHGGGVTSMVLGTAPTNIEQFSYNNTNFLSCMTLDVENRSARFCSSQEIGHHRVTIFSVRKTAKKGLKR